MKTLLSLSAAALLATGLAACAGGMNVQSASTDAVTIEHSVDRKSDATAQAEQLCGNYGKRARFRVSHDQPQNGYQYSIYDCIAR
jgi:hypothetical protein